MKNFLNWLTVAGGWKVIIMFTYVTICFFDFVVVPTWIGLYRIDVELLLSQLLSMSDMHVTVQQELIKHATYQHQPFTLGYGGVFHLAFGAILTGSAITSDKKPTK